MTFEIINGSGFAIVCRKALLKDAVRLIEQEQKRPREAAALIYESYVGQPIKQHSGTQYETNINKIEKAIRRLRRKPTE